MHIIAILAFAAFGGRLFSESGRDEYKKGERTLATTLHRGAFPRATTHAYAPPVDKSPRLAVQRAHGACSCRIAVESAGCDGLEARARGGRAGLSESVERGCECYTRGGLFSAGSKGTTARNAHKVVEHHRVSVFVRARTCIHVCTYVCMYVIRSRSHRDVEIRDHQLLEQKKQLLLQV